MRKDELKEGDPEPAAETDPAADGEDKGAEVVSLDAFRKKP